MQTLAIILLSILSLFALAASFLLMRGLFPAKVELVRQTLENHWKRSFWIGLLNTVLITVFVIGLSSLGQGVPVFFILAFVIYGAFLIGLLFGLTALVTLLGERLYPDLIPTRREIRAGAITLLASLLPAVGWFLLFPYLISLGVGAVVITLFKKKNQKMITEETAD